MELHNYLPILIQVVVAIVIASGILLTSQLLGQRGRRNPIKDTAYECGILPIGKEKTQFSVKFYVVAMLFILFDIEIVFLLPWVLVYREFFTAAIPILMPGLFFIGILIVGLLYEIKKGGLKWEK